MFRNLNISSDNPYHNFRHAFCVTQMVYSILNVISKETEIDKDSWGVLIIAAIAHDVGTVLQIYTGLGPRSGPISRPRSGLDI